LPLYGRKLDSGTLKVKVVASFDKEDNSGATALVVRDSDGLLIQAQAEGFCC
jgi:hypothetical protein